MTVTPYHIYVVGLGINSTLQMTRETVQVLGLCRKVYYLHTNPEWVEPQLRQICSDVEDLHDCYSEGDGRFDTYKLMAEKVLESARRPPVAFALYGSPVVLVTPTVLIEEGARSNDMRVKVLPAVSAMENMFVALGIDPAEGVLTLEANDILLYRRRLLPEVHCFIWQIGGVETGLYTERSSRSSRFYRIRDHLLRFYSEDHDAIIVSCASLPVLKHLLIRATVGSLAEFADELHQGVTLYLPPAVEGLQVDSQFAELLESPEHLKAITTDPPR